MSIALAPAADPASPGSPPPWSFWRAHFERNRRRPLPPICDVAALPAAPARALAWSLARFQIGETGEGRIVGSVARSRMAAIDDDYRCALALFIAEEGRHAHVLALMVRALGGRILRGTWTERVFVVARRLLGIRCKLMMMFAAEIVGIGFYGALAAHLPRCPTRAALEQIAGDERAHLLFHRQFFALAAPGGWRRALFRAAWAVVAPAAALAVLWDHRGTLRALGIPARGLRRRLFDLIRQGAR